MSTQRTKAELDALFADNTTGLITPSMLRDFVESALPSRGAIHLPDNAAPTVITSMGQYAKVDLVGTLEQGFRFDMPANSRLRYTGTKDISARIVSTLSLTLASGSGDLVTSAIGVNNAVLLPSIAKTKLAASGDIQAIVSIVDTVLHLNDYIELFLSNESTTADIICAHGYFAVLGFMT